MTAVLTPSLVQQFFSTAGAPLVGGLLFCYAGGTTTKQNAFTDSTQVTALPNPIILNARGEVAPSANGTSCGLWLDPTLTYKFTLAPAGDTDPPSAPIWSVDNVVNPIAAIASQIATYQASLTGIMVGAQLPYAGNATTAPAGYLFCDGSAVSRSTYSKLFAVIGASYGAGDGSSTFNLPDKRGRVSVGRDNMNGTAANRVTTAGSGIDGITLGAAGGDQRIAAHSHAVTDPGHVHATTEAAHHHQQKYVALFPGSGTTEGNVTNAQGPGTLSPDVSTGDTATGLTVNSATTGISVNSTGAGASANMPPAQIDNWIIYAGV